MKKVFLAFLLVTTALFASSQNYTPVLLSYTTAKFEEAKKEVDKLMVDPKAKDKAETYMWKLKVYSELYGDTTLNSKYPEAGKEAIEALDKYIALEPGMKLLKEDLRPVSLLYGQAFNYGRNFFQKSDWPNAYNSFAMCQQVSEFIGKNGLTSSGKYTIDTTVVLYTAYAAQNAGKASEAALRYKMLADYKIADKDFEDVYKFILDYDTRQKDEASFKKYLAVARESFPNSNSLWNQFDMNYMSMNSNLLDIVAKYKADDAAGKLKEDDYITYAESFASPDKSQVSQLDSNQQDNLKKAAADAFEKAFNLNNSNGLYAFNAGVLYYSIFGELDDRYYNFRGESADLKAKREAIVKDQQEVGAKSILWLEKGYNALKAKDPREKTEANSLNRSVDYLANLYLWKRDKSRGVNPKDYDALDVKYKLFDGEHDKYKQ